MSERPNPPTNGAGADVGVLRTWPPRVERSWRRTHAIAVAALGAAAAASRADAALPMPMSEGPARQLEDLVFPEQIGYTEFQFSASGAGNQLYQSIDNIVFSGFPRANTMEAVYPTNRVWIDYNIRLDPTSTATVTRYTTMNVLMTDASVGTATQFPFLRYIGAEPLRAWNPEGYATGGVGLLNGRFEVTVYPVTRLGILFQWAQSAGDTNWNVWMRVWRVPQDWSGAAY